MPRDASVRRDVVHGETLRLGIVALVNRLPYLGQHETCAGVDVVVWCAAPEGVFVQLYRVALQTAVHHCADASVAERQGLYPVVGGAVIPQHVLRGGGRVTVLADSHQQYGGKQPCHCKVLYFHISLLSFLILSLTNVFAGIPISYDSKCKNTQLPVICQTFAYIFLSSPLFLYLSQ